MQAHSAAELFPLMKGEEFETLVRDIKENGLLNPIIVHPEGGIIDGRNRLRACDKAGVEPLFKTWDGKGSLTSLVISLNLHRRHLTISQRAMVAADAKPLFEDEAAKRMIAGKKPDPSAELREGGKASENAAKQFDVSPRSVESANAVIRDGVKELEDAVRAGDIPVSTAEKVARQPEQIQKEFADQTPQERTKTLKKLSKQNWFSDEELDKFQEIGRAHV